MRVSWKEHLKIVHVLSVFPFVYVCARVFMFWKSADLDILSCDEMSHLIILY